MIVFKSTKNFRPFTHPPPPDTINPMWGIISQTGALDALQSSLQSDRLHHAYIFHGPAGVGKFTTARAFAKALLCDAPQTDLQGTVSPCDACQSCRLMGTATTAGDTDSTAQHSAAHPDFHVVTKELARFSDDASVRNRKLTSIPVDVLRRSLLDPVYRAAQLSRRKVLIVDEAELLNPTGQNLLLKTLEEPPPGTHLILVTASEPRLLVTIRSRCQRVSFVPLADDAVADWLSQQEHALSDAQQSWLVGFASGSLGRAQLAIEYDLAKWAEAVLPLIDGMAKGQFPVDLGQDIAAMIDAFAKQWVDDHDGASKEAANQQAAGLMWSLIAQHAREKIRNTAAQCDPQDPEAGEAALGPWLGVIDALGSAQQALASHVNLGLATDQLVFLLHRCFQGSQPAPLSLLTAP